MADDGFSASHWKKRCHELEEVLAKERSARVDSLSDEYDNAFGRVEEALEALGGETIELFGDDGNTVTVKISDGLWAKRLRAENVHKRLDTIETGLKARLEQCEETIHRLREENKNLAFEVNRRPTPRQLYESERRSELLDERLKRAKQRKDVTPSEDIFMRKTLHTMGSLEKLRESIRRAPPKEETVRGLLAASGSAESRDIDIENACRILVLKACTELAIESPLDLVPVARKLKRSSSLQSQEEHFIETVCGAIQRMIRGSIEDAESKANPEKSASKLASQRANPDLPPTLTLREAVRDMQRIERYVVAMRQLQKSPATFAHELILKFQRFANAESVASIPPKMDAVLETLLDARSFASELRELLSLEPDQPYDDILAVLKGYVRAFGLPPRDAMLHLNK